MIGWLKRLFRRNPEEHHLISKSVDAEVLESYRARVLAAELAQAAAASIAREWRETHGLPEPNPDLLRRAEAQADGRTLATVARFETTGEGVLNAIAMGATPMMSQHGICGYQWGGAAVYTKDDINEIIANWRYGQRPFRRPDDPEPNPWRNEP